MELIAVEDVFSVVAGRRPLHSLVRDYGQNCLDCIDAGSVDDALVGADALEAAGDLSEAEYHRAQAEMGGWFLHYAEVLEGWNGGAGQG